MRQAAAVLLLAGSLIGCAGNAVDESPWLVQRDTAAPRSCEPLTADQELVLGLSREMAGSGSLHAALANLERLPSDLPQGRLSKAQLLRLLGHSSEAEALYAGLLNSCLVADARHGLGQIAAARGDYAEAQEYLRSAASLAPANQAIRNDLGVVYMNQGRMSEARFELLTAMELAENSRGVAVNMLTLLMYEDNWQAAQELVAAKGLSSSDFSRAEQRARSMRSQSGNAAAPASMGSAQPLATPDPVGMAEAVASLTAPAEASVPGRSVGTTAAAVSAADAAPVKKLAPAPTPLRAFAAESVPASARTPQPLATAVQAWTGEQTTTAPSGQQAENVQQAATGARPLICRSRESGDGRAVLECLTE